MWFFFSFGRVFTFKCTYVKKKKKQRKERANEMLLNVCVCVCVCVCMCVPVETQLLSFLPWQISVGSGSLFISFHSPTFFFF